MNREHPHCPLCSATRVEAKPTYTAMLGLRGHSDSGVVGCVDCGAYFLWPYISDELIDELYGRAYFTGVYDEGGELATPGSNSDYESGVALDRMGKFRQTVRTLRAMSPGARRILDVGAATGEFLAVAREQGLAVSGVEISEYAAQQAKQKYGFDFHRTTIADYPGTDKHDLIHMNHVFEHFREPHAVLERLQDLLSPGGLIYVEVPFQFNVIERLKYRLTGRGKPFDVASIHHPLFYRPATLKRIFAEHGFSCTRMRVFDWSRYPAGDLRGRAKRLMWFVASMIGQGLMIEAVFERTAESAR